MSVRDRLCIYQICYYLHVTTPCYYLHVRSIGIVIVHAATPHVRRILPRTPYDYSELSPRERTKFGFALGRIDEIDEIDERAHQVRLRSCLAARRDLSQKLAAREHAPDALAGLHHTRRSGCA